MRTDAKAAVKPGPPAATRPAPAPSRFAVAASDATSSVDIAAIKEAVSAARKGDTSRAEDLKKTISDPVGRKLVEWAILRSDETESVDFDRYMAFVTENPSWPAVGMLRRRAEATLWSDRRDPGFVRAFFANYPADHAPRASSRSPVRSCCKVTVPARKAWCAKHGITTIFRASSKAWRWTSSGT